MLKNMKRWQNVNALYQIYPRSFYDASGDGVGDLNGITAKLEYLKGGVNSVGVDAIWISPFYPSPMVDFGYDIANYCDVDPIFGTLDDFRNLLSEAHRHDIKVMVDFVPNHTSDKHEWFINSKTAKNSSKRDYYVWRDAKADGSVPNNWLSTFGGSAWQWDQNTQQYYLHSFLKEQPDLNWDNPDVRAAMADVLRFWLDIGVDGFRVDVARYISKDTEYRNDSINMAYGNIAEAQDPYHGLLHNHSQYGPRLFDFLHELTQVVDKYDDRIMVFEDYPEENRSIAEQYRAFYDVHPGVGMPFNFQGINCQWDADAFGSFINNFQELLHTGERPLYCFGNHDQPRIVSRFGSKQARLLALLQLTLPGLPVIYNGEELGMENGDITSNEMKDPAEKYTPGIGMGRDPQRTPMQWSAKENAGFSQTKPWLPIGTRYRTLNVENESSNDDSFLTLYRKLLSLRRDDVTLREGDFQLSSKTASQVLTYRRQSSEGIYIVVLNFSADVKEVDIGSTGEFVMSTHSAFASDISNAHLALKPYEGVLLRVSL